MKFTDKELTDKEFTDKSIILFDLDGTITDSGEGIKNSLRYAMKAYGITDYDEDLLQKFIGPPLTESYMNFLGFDELKAKEAVEKFREYFKDIGIFENRVYEGIESLLKRLQEDGRKLILATSKAEVFTYMILEHFKITHYFYAVAGSELDGTRTNKSDVIRYALGKAGNFELKDVVMIGDREQDIKGAIEVGIDSIGVLYGYGNYEELQNASATVIVETVEDLYKILVGYHMP